MVKEYTYNGTGKALSRIPDKKPSLTELKPLYPPTAADRFWGFVSRHDRVIAAAALSAAVLLASIGCSSTSEASKQNSKHPTGHYELAPGEVFIPSQRPEARTPEVTARAVVNSRDGISTEVTCYLRELVEVVPSGKSAVSLMTSADGEQVLDKDTFIPAPMTNGDGLDNPAFDQQAVIDNQDFQVGQPADLPVSLRNELATALRPDILALNDNHEPRAGESYALPSICVVSQSASTPS